jgi:hypothetical protein
MPGIRQIEIRTLTAVRCGVALDRTEAITKMAVVKAEVA